MGFEMKMMGRCADKGSPAPNINVQPAGVRAFAIQKRGGEQAADHQRFNRVGIRHSMLFHVKILSTYERIRWP